MSLCLFCDLYVGYRGYEVWDIMTLTRLNLSCIESWDDAFDFFRLSRSFRCVPSNLHILHHSAARQTLWVSASAPKICQLLIWRNPEAVWMKIIFFFSIVFDIKLRAMEPDPHDENSVFANRKMIKETLMTWEFFNVNPPHHGLLLFQGQKKKPHASCTPPKTKRDNGKTRYFMKMYLCISY